MTNSYRWLNRQSTTDITNYKDMPVNINLMQKSSPVTGLEWPRGFQEVKVPRLYDNGTGWW